jgi:enamine deaminase RidA (YjgF/YER057c/UK114 family)
MEQTYNGLHFAPAVRDGALLLCSGQVKSVLAAAEATFEDVVEMTTFHVGFNTHIAKFMKVKDLYVPAPYPAWTAVGVSELAWGALVEVKVIARLPH